MTSQDEPDSSHPDQQETPAAPLHFELRKDGPVMVTGPFTLDNGEEIAEGKKMALCRCGASNNKPRCDGAHKATGFTAAGVEPARKPEERTGQN